MEVIVANSILKKNKIRLCHVVPICLGDFIDQLSAELKPFCEQITTPSASSSQAIAVTKIANACTGRPDSVFADALLLLIKILLQCPLKANLVEKILGCLTTLRCSRRCMFNKEVTRILLVWLKDNNAATNVAISNQLCQVLNLIQTTALLEMDAEFEQSLNSREYERSTAHTNLKCLQARDNYHEETGAVYQHFREIGEAQDVSHTFNDLCSRQDCSIADECIDERFQQCAEQSSVKCLEAREECQKLELHCAVCSSVSRTVHHLKEISFSSLVSHVNASSNQQALQHLINCSLAYLQLLVPAVPNGNEKNCSADDSRDSLFFRAVIQHSETNKYIFSIYEDVVQILASNNSILDLRLISGQLLATLSLFMPGGIMNLINTFISTKDKEQINGEEVFFLCNADSIIKNCLLKELSKLGHVAVLHGILCTVPADQLFTVKVTSLDKSDEEPTDKQVLGILILEQVLLYINSSDDSELILSCSRLLNHWTLRVLNHKSNCRLLSTSLMLAGGELEQRLLHCLWFTWEHYLDRVKHVTYETFMNFLEIRHKGFASGADEYFMSMLNKHMHLVPQQKASVNALRCLLKYLSVTEVLQQHPLLPGCLVVNLSDFSRAGCCAELLKALFTGHAAELEMHAWQQYWIPLLFDSFHADMMTFGYELLVKSLLVAVPACLPFAVSYILCESNDLSYDRFMLLISCVKIARNNKGLELEREQTGLSATGSATWRGLLPYHVIQSALFHADDRVQVSAFGLLCESSKVSEKVLSSELTLLCEFLKNGVCIDVPSQRQVLLSYAKKLFVRLRDSGNAQFKAQESSKRWASLCQHSNSPVAEAPTKLAESSSTRDTNLLESYSLFCRDVFASLTANLHVASSFPRRSCSLLLLQLLQDVVIRGSQWAKAEHLEALLSSEVYVLSLVECLNDNYETNKVVAMQLLHRNERSYEVTTQTMSIESLLECVFSMASSTKPHDSLTASYIFKFIQDHSMLVQSLRKINCISKVPANCPLHLFICYHFLHKLNAEVSTASTNLALAVTCQPMYGHLTCLRVVLADVTADAFQRDHLQWSVFMEHLLQACYDAHAAVRSIVENDSPEGNVTRELSDLVAEVNSTVDMTDLNEGASLGVKCTTAQMLLLCGWRTVKEISLILGDITQSLPIFPASKAVLGVSELTKIGEYFLSVLVETKHRGAFEQTYTGFLKVCQRLWMCTSPELSTLPEKWVSNVLGDIETETEENFCATRRSAGIPFIIQAILATEPATHGNSSLKTTMRSLLHFACSPSYHDSFTRLHSFNILRALYKDTKLGDVIVPFVADGVKTAIEGFSSTWWCIRNAATLLFAALVTRMLGVKRNKDDLHAKNSMSGLVFFKRFPSLYRYLLQKLEAGARAIELDHLAAALYPVLLLLARLSPAPLEGVTSALTLSTFVPFVIKCTQSQIYQVRELASRALAPLVHVDNLQVVVAGLCDQACQSRQNAVHGALLSLRQLLQTILSHISSQTVTDAILGDVTSLVSLAMPENPCLLTQALAIDLFHLLIEEKWLSPDSVVVADLYGCLLEQIRHFEEASGGGFENIPGIVLFQRSAVTFVLKLWGSGIFTDDATAKLLLSSKSADIRCAALRYMQVSVVPLEGVHQCCVDAVTLEEDVECRVAMYAILTASLQRCGRVPLGVKRSEDDASSNSHRVAALLEGLLSKVEKEHVSEEELKLLIPLLHQGVVHGSQEENLRVFPVLALRLLQWSAPHQHPAVRLATTRAAVALAAAWIQTSSHTADYDEGAAAQTLECLCSSLQDDDGAVRRAAAEVWGALVGAAGDTGEEHRRFGAAARQAVQAALGEEGSGYCGTAPPGSMRPRQTLVALLHFMGHVGSPALSSLLVAAALQTSGAEEDERDKEDRVFDRSEAGTHVEVVQMAAEASAVLASVPHAASLLFCRQHLQPHLRTPFWRGTDRRHLQQQSCDAAWPSEASLKSRSEIKGGSSFTSSTLVSAPALLEWLARDMAAIVRQLQAADVTTDLAKRLTLADEWLPALTQRALLVRSLWQRCYCGTATRGDTNGGDVGDDVTHDTNGGDVGDDVTRDTNDGDVGDDVTHDTNGDDVTRDTNGGDVGDDVTRDTNRACVVQLLRSVKAALDAVPLRGALLARARVQVEAVLGEEQRL